MLQQSSEHQGHTGTEKRAASRLAVGNSGLRIKQMLTDPVLFTLWGHLGE